MARLARRRIIQSGRLTVMEPSSTSQWTMITSAPGRGSVCSSEDLAPSTARPNQSHVDPVGHVDGHGPEPDLGLDGRDLLLDDGLLHLQVTVAQNRTDRQPGRHDPGTLARLVAQHSGDLLRDHRQLARRDRGLAVGGQVIGQPGQLTERARTQGRLAALGILLQRQPALGDGGGQGLDRAIAVMDSYCQP
jgi:hypothetical protein